MRRFEMEIYTAHDGIEMTIAWANEEEYRLGQVFLKDMAGGPCGGSEFDPDRPEFYYLETKQQLDALYDFSRDLRNRRKGGAA
jgi:hypothetical protein